MPEIAEVERARLRIHRQCLNHIITNVETVPDHIVFKDVEHEAFAKAIMNKTLVDTKRWGKYFVLLFEGDGPHIVAHFGMTGGIRFKHEELAKGLEWPPRFYKLLITFTDPKTKEEIYFGFRDPRRLARLRLISARDPLLVEPISKLGFDPVLNMPDFEQFKQLVTRRAVPVKALLLDQSFSAGVGNWVADEILYQAMIHPAQYTNTLTDKELDDMYNKMKYVCELAVQVEADESKFPEDWLMKHRWNKGKNNEVKGKLPNGLELKFETVGGRTSAFAPARQKLRVSIQTKRKTITVKKEMKKEEVEEEDKKKLKKPRKTIKKEITVKEEEEEVIIKRPIRVASTRYNFRRAILVHYLLKKNQDRKQKIKPHEERVVIIGCSSGIGKECALSYASRGASLILFARRSELLEELKQQCLEAGSSKTVYLAGDATIEDDLIRLAQLTKETFEGDIDTVIYCAGMISVRPFLDSCGIKINKDADGSLSISEHSNQQEINSALQKITTINYFASIWTARLFIPLLIKSKSPNFLIVSSMAGKVGAPTRAFYSGSKHALHGFFDSLRVELEPYGIHIGLICPGTVDTNLRQSAVDKSLGEGSIAGSKKNKLSPKIVADRIIQASDAREREVYIPAWFGYLAIWAKLLASPVVDWAAAQKYKT
ncbi:uncharacterized protein BX663DRAFT_535670 [Cokeromyces recurvatus]|uniref:uncharacterized protein n=1 Tax=Cokeromyces recurvatus TaxID=90255 RepID=UPI00222076F6|nr:uncharacterized protein BX663DRAFT_535670 [Cokeromyces recurvatus]KAI7904897.1 hypothetical protein BX663DRAFT_535670 [Cokeromyces recurvatus]